ncbi:transcriptional antiterminator [Pullulanibacillus camelliae]|uniref:Transcriptional antiterminator n=1 Tax=Pullulanibacillus camelliae TaxID=1707096 RepID=A0A8J2VEJ2_9BACL|nr:sigma 54-interacting transcriptional regulator [Pullulanibacillus camelliae]GGE25907.1 transcriptional antiterminator [Pullulanibacillus camelliae]
MKKELIIDYIKEATQAFLFHDEYDLSQLQTNVIAHHFSMERTSISRILNDAVKEGLLIKINTRPVYFLHKSTIENNFGMIQENEYKNIEELKNSLTRHQTKTVFQEIIGHDKSLKEVIEQMKTAIFYPENGLPIMLIGPTGVGKTHLAQLMYKYIKNQNLILRDAPFHIFNCAQYANNPELLSSHLFGHAKGAYTGADKDKSGLLERADQGVLFLDEVHCLSREGQEKLFTFMDQGTFSRLGENDTLRKARVRLIFATTESLSCFLDTFLRRIPIKVTIPSLEERGTQEKNQFIQYFFMEESKLFQLPIEVSNKTIEVLNHHEYIGNIGECKNIIKYTCGCAYANKTQDTDIIKVTINDLPKEIFKKSPHLFDNYIPHEGAYVFQPDSKTVASKNNERQKGRIRNSFFNCLNYFKNADDQTWQEDVSHQKIIEEITVLMDHLIFKRPNNNMNIMMEITINSLQKTFRYLETNYNMKYDGNFLYAVASYLFFKPVVLHLSEQEETLFHAMCHYYEHKLKREYLYVLKLKPFIENGLDIKLDDFDTLLITLFLSTTEMPHHQNRAKAMIIAHGYATASSIANVCNRILRSNIYDSMDMEIEATSTDIIEKLQHYLELNETVNGLLIFIDMGSLNLIHDHIQEHIDGPLLFIDQVTTMTALEAGQYIMNGFTINDIAIKMKQVDKPKINLFYPKKKKEFAIITSCFTGIGTATQIEDLLTESIKDDIAIKIISHDFERLKHNGIQEAPFQLYDVLAIVGTENPNIPEINFIPLEDIISGKGERDVFRIFEKVADAETIRRVNDKIIINFSLNRVIDSLTILDTDKLIKSVEKGIVQLEKKLGKKISNDKKISLFVHVSCMVERLIRLSPIEEYPNQLQFEQAHTKEITMIKNAFSVLESNYCVQLNIPEIGYIYNIIFGY